MATMHKTSLNEIACMRIGQKGININELSDFIMSLKNNTMLLKQISCFMIKINTDSLQRIEINQKLKETPSLLEDCLVTILEEWSGRSPENATLVNLCSVFNSCNLSAISKSVIEKFTQAVNHAFRKQTKNTWPNWVKYSCKETCQCPSKDSILTESVAQSFTKEKIDETCIQLIRSNKRSNKKERETSTMSPRQTACRKILKQTKFALLANIPLIIIIIIAHGAHPLYTILTHGNTNSGKCPVNSSHFNTSTPTQCATVKQEAMEETDLQVPPIVTLSWNQDINDDTQQMCKVVVFTSLHEYEENINMIKNTDDPCTLIKIVLDGQESAHINITKDFQTTWFCEVMINRMYELFVANIVTSMRFIQDLTLKYFLNTCNITANDARYEFKKVYLPLVESLTIENIGHCSQILMELIENFEFLHLKVLKFKNINIDKYVVYSLQSFFKRHRFSIQQIFFESTTLTYSLFSEFDRVLPKLESLSYEVSNVSQNISLLGNNFYHVFPNLKRYTGKNEYMQLPHFLKFYQLKELEDLSVGIQITSNEILSLKDLLKELPKLKTLNIYLSSKDSGKCSVAGGNVSSSQVIVSLRRNCEIVYVE